MPRILILHASVGNGHKTAAFALKEELEKHSGVEVVVEDLLDYALPVFKAIYADSYLELSEKAPDFIDSLYKMADTSNSKFRKDLITFISKVGVPNFKAFGQDQAPDIIIHTHQLGISLLKDKVAGHPGIKTYAVITDYTTNMLWVHDEIDRYFVASDLVSDMLTSRGISSKKISISGIPSRLEQNKPKTTTSMKKQFGITKEPVCLLLGAGISTTKIMPMIADLNEQKSVGTLVVVCGRNIALEKSLLALDRHRFAMDTIVYGFTDRLDDLIVASDIVITKAGGLITSELLNRKKAVILLCGIRGQEEWNADYISSQGAAVQVHVPELVPYAVKTILTDTELRKNLLTRAQKLSFPNASRTISEQILADWM